MSLPLFYFKNIFLSFGQEKLFSDVSGQISAKDRICLVGKNGSGKSTLLKILAGIMDADKGELYIEPGKKIGFLSQQPIIDENDTVYQYVLHNVPNPEQKAYLVDIVLDALKLSGDQSLNKLSGGNLRRADLAKTLVAEPDILLLDEPTNHLDIESIEWLEEYIQNFNGGSVIISHDRAFLRNVSNKTLWIDRGKLFINNKGFSDFERWSDEVFLQEERELIKLGKELDKENLWLQQGVTARRKRNQQRLANLHALRAKLKTDKSRFSSINSSINLEQESQQNKAKLLLEMTNVSFKFTDVKPEKLILNPFSLNIMKNEAIGVMGRNGAGKSTLIKLITGELKPNTGAIRYGANLRISYLDQARSELNPNMTLWETLCPGGGDTVFLHNKPKHVAAYLKDFLFSSKQINAKASTLSGGEQNRLLLAKLLLAPGNLLILDEPTNDLDMDTLDMLVEILSEYPGSLLIVSHDRDFLERLTTRTIIVEQPNLFEHVGCYYDYVQEAREAKKPKIVKTVQEKAKVQTKLSYKDERELSLLPATIDQLMASIVEMEQAISVPNLYQDDPTKFTLLSKILEDTKIKLEQAETRWFELEELKQSF